MIRRPPRSTLSSSSAASDVYKRQDDGQALGYRNSFLEQLDAFRGQLHGYEGQSGYIAARVGQALDQADFDRVAPTDKHDRDFIRRLRGGERLRRTNREDDVHTKLDELRGELRKTLLPAFRVAMLNEEVFAFDIAELAAELVQFG